MGSGAPSRFKCSPGDLVSAKAKALKTEDEGGVAPLGESSDEAGCS